MSVSRTIMGYRRNDGRCGLRDHVLVLSTVALTNRWAELIARTRDDCLLIAGETIRGARGGDAEAQDRLVLDLARHPSVGAALLLTQDPVSAGRLRDALGNVGRPVEVLSLLDCAGMADAVERGRRALQTLAGARDASAEAIGLGGLTLALECGGSDPTSALASNAAIGRFVDRVVEAGGTAIVSETAEFIGTERIVSERTPDAETRDAILAHVARRERWHAEDGEDYRGTNPTAENIAGGLTTLVEKSMGAVAKTGTSAFVGALAFGEAPKRSGLHFMDSPFFTPLSLTGMVGAGANVALFGIGQFNPSANPLVPTIKVCGNARTARRWADAIDVDASVVLSEDASLDEMADRIHSAVADAGAGRPTAAERWGEGQFIMPRNHAPL